MAEQDNDRLGPQPIDVPNWDLGIITSAPANEIPDNAAQELLNWEFDDGGNISTRAGLTALMATTFANRITSTHYFKTETGEVGVLFTTGATLHIVQTNGTGHANITGSLILPSDRFWQWRTFAGLAIGVNRATTGTNPVKVNSSSVAAALGGSPPKASYIEVWNNRVFLIGAVDINTVYGSKLGDPETWSTAGPTTATDAFAIEVDADDGDQFMGIYATKDALYLFKRKRIYRMVPIDTAKPVTDATNLKVELYASNIGCVSGYSIQSMLDDVVFLSEQGLASLALAQNVEDFRTALLSRNVIEIQRFPKITDEIPSVLMDTASQYWLSLPSNISPTTSPLVYVMDYALRPLPNGTVRWCRFNGKVAGTAFTAWVDSIGKVFLIGAANGAGAFQLYLYRPKDYTVVFSDDGAAYTKQIISKAFTAGEPLLRKDWLKWGLATSLLSDSAQLSVQYYFDSNPAKGGSYPFSLSGTLAGARWDSAIWDTSIWDSAVNVPQDIWRKLLVNSSGQRSQDITFVFVNGQPGEGIQIRDFKMLYSLLTEKEVSEL